MKFYVGTSGWQYSGWQGKLYPRELAKTRWLNYYAGQFNTVEIDSTFYRLPGDAAVEQWYTDTPPGFCITLKASRYVTHVKRPHEAGEATGEFLKRANILKEKLGVVRFQLPPNMRRDEARLDSFLSSFPEDIKFAMEFRDKSWFTADVWDILHKYRVAFCIMDMPGLSMPVIATTTFAYMRFHGSLLLYATRYTKASLRKWADRLKQLQGIKQAYVYFNNDFSGFAVENARVIQELLLQADWFHLACLSISLTLKRAGGKLQPDALPRRVKCPASPGSS